MVPITALPRPRIARRSPLGNDDDTSSLPRRGVLDAIPFSRRRNERLDTQVRLLHHEVITIKPMPDALLALERNRRFGILRHVAAPGSSERQNEGKRRRHNSETRVINNHSSQLSSRIRLSASQYESRRALETRQKHPEEKSAQTSCWP